MIIGVKVFVRFFLKFVEEIDLFVKVGFFSNRSDLIKEVIWYYFREFRKEFMEEERWRLKVVEDVFKEDWESEEDSFWDFY